MKRIFLIFYFAFTIYILGISQENLKYEYVGTISVTGGDVMSYKIVFNLKNNNEFEGYSITDYMGENLTKTAISGRYDTIKNILSFTEGNNIVTKADEAESDFCFISAKKLTIKDLNGNEFISGDFEGLFPSGEFCAKGKIFLTEANIIRKIQNTIDSTNLKDVAVNQPEDTVKILEEQQNLYIKSNDKLLNKFCGNNLQLQIWDGEVEDNDIINIYLNDTLFKENIILTNQKRNISLPVEYSSFNLKIIAINEGYSGVNTVNFAITDSLGIKEFTSVLRKGESFDVKFQDKSK